MKHLLFGILLSSCLWGVIGEAHAQNDPKAKAALDRMRKKYEAYQSLEGEFNLTIEIPEQPKEVQKGKLSQKGDKYRVELAGQTIMSDGKAVWIILAKNKEVQISDLPDPSDDDQFLSPQSLLRIYDKKNLTFALVNEYAEGTKIIQQIEFKPTDRMSDYAKMRLSLDKKTGDFIEMKVFAKDGSRYSLKLTKVTPNKAFADSAFVFTKDQCAGCYIEDMRN